MNRLQYSLIISISVHALILWWVFSTVPFRYNRISQTNVALLSDLPEISKSEGTSTTRQSRQPLKRSQPANPGRLAPSSGKARAAAEPLETPTLEPMESEPTGGGVPLGGESILPSEGPGARQLGVETAVKAGGVGIGSQSMVSSQAGSRPAAKGPPSGRGDHQKLVAANHPVPPEKAPRHLRLIRFQEQRFPAM